MPHGPPPVWLVVVATSSGGFKALLDLVSQLPSDLLATVLVVSHTPTNSRRGLPVLLSAAGPLPASYPSEGQGLEAGRIFVAPPDRHLVVERGRVHLSSGRKVHHLRPAADVLFHSAARAFGSRTLGIVLSGGGSDGAAGLAAIQAAGGLTLIQAPNDAQLATMPLSALAQVRPEACVPTAELGSAVARLLRERDPAARARARGMTGEQASRKSSHAPFVKGLRVFLAEDDYLMASEITGMLRELNCDTVGPVADVAAGLRLLKQECKGLDCAVLDVDLRGEQVLPLALMLTRWTVPFLFATGYGEAVLPEAWAGAPRLQKPYDTQTLGVALRRALRLRWFPPLGAPTSVSGIAYQEEILKSSRNLLMRSHALRGLSSREVLKRSYDAIRSTHACIAASSLRQAASRRTLRALPPSEAPADDTGEDDA